MALPQAFDDLLNERVWVAWDDGSGQKVPKSPYGGNARSNDSSTWGTYAEAEALRSQNNYSGIGIMLSDGLLGIDLDDVVDDDGVIAEWAYEIIKELGSYAEISPSGNGIHILGWADVNVVGAIGTTKSSIEVYNNRRFFTVTGQTINDEAIYDLTEDLDGFMSRWVSGGSAESAVRKSVGALAADEVKRLANQTMTNNCIRDGVRYARVPTGFETCGFCIMLASRGFVYHSADTAGAFDHYHRSCDCVVTAGFPGLTEIEGYNVDEYLDLYLEATNRLGDGASTSQLSHEIEKILAERAGRSKAVILKEKLTQYALDKTSAKGRDKAIAFESALGFTADDADEIMAQVYRWMGKNDPIEIGEDEWGTRYTTNMVMTGKNGKTARVVVGWIREPGSDIMRLTTIHVAKRGG